MLVAAMFQAGRKALAPCVACRGDPTCRRDRVSSGLSLLARIGKKGRSETVDVQT